MTVVGFPKTYRSECRDCGETIFVHTNGYGDWVLFDELGPPWPIHACYEIHRELGHGLRDVKASAGREQSDDRFKRMSIRRTALESAAAAEETATSVPGSSDPTPDDSEELSATADMPSLMAELVRVFGARRAPQHEPLTLGTSRRRRGATNEANRDTKPPKASEPPAEQPESALDIERCEPAFFLHRNLTVTGFLREIITGKTIGGLAAAGTIGHAVYRRLLGTERYSQVTVIDSDLVSYTVVVPMPDVKLQKGAVVRMHLRAVRTPHQPIFICDALDEIAFKRI